MSLSPNANTFSMYKSIVCIKQVCYLTMVSLWTPRQRSSCVFLIVLSQTWTKFVVISATAAKNKATIEAPTERPGQRRLEEMRELYGAGSAMIHGMETAMQLTFDKNCDRKQPRLWPALPLNIKFNWCIRILLSSDIDRLICDKFVQLASFLKIQSKFDISLASGNCSQVPSLAMSPA